MKVAVGYFTTESNANIKTKCKISNYDIAFGDECIIKCKIKDVFESNNIELIPLIYANAAGAGVIEKETFEYIESCFINNIKANLNNIDGIWLHLHGASYVEEIGSGDHHILKEIRKIVGPYLPIAIVCDPHGNLTKEYVENCTIIRSYRESPHTDADKTKKLVAKMLCNLLKHRQNIHALYHKLPLILGGEQSVSTDEPVLSINKYMNEMEKDSRIRSVSWHVGYLRHDCPEAGCGIVIVPKTHEDIEYCKKKLDELANYIWNKRHEFHYTGYTLVPDKALDEALSFDGKPVFITDSGDNTTSGASGENAYILRQLLVKKLDKKVLIANITDASCVKHLQNYQVNEEVIINLGKDDNELNKAISLKVQIISFAKMVGNKWSGRDKVWGDIVNVKVVDKPLYITISSCNNSMTEINQFVNAKLDINDYEIIVVKQGYLFPELKEITKFWIMSLTDGATPQDTRLIPFKQIMRPMYPIDEM